MIIASAEEGVSKPVKRIFEIAFELANYNAENAVMTGDCIDNDNVPAKKIGIKTVWIKQDFGKFWKLSCPEETPDFEVNNLTDLLEKF